MPSLSDPPIFVPRIRIWGNVQWICPYSGHFNSDRMTAQSYRLTCRPTSDLRCGRRFVPGVVLYPISPGRPARSFPPDWVIPDLYKSQVGMREAFPMGDLAVNRWQYHHPTHVLVDPESADYNVGVMVRHVRIVAETGLGSSLVHEVAKQDAQPESRLARLGAAFELVAAEYGLNV